jgi:hypothetical protein
MTMIEALAFMLGTSILLSVVYVLVSGLLHAHHDGQMQDERWQTIERLAGQLRTDGHAAAAAKLANPTDLELVLSADEMIVYSVQPRRIVRTHRRGGQLVQRETYRLADDWSVTWKVPGSEGPGTDDGKRGLVVMKLARDEPGREPAPICQIEVAVGPDRELAGQVKE